MWCRASDQAISFGPIRRNKFLRTALQAGIRRLRLQLRGRFSFSPVERPMQDGVGSRFFGRFVLGLAACIVACIGRRMLFQDFSWVWDAHAWLGSCGRFPKATRLRIEDRG